MENSELKSIIKNIDTMPVWKALALYNNFVSESTYDYEEPKEEDARHLVCFDDGNGYKPFLMTIDDVMKDYRWLADTFGHLSVTIKNDEVSIQSGDLVRDYGQIDVWEGLLRFAIEKTVRNKILSRNGFLNKLHQRSHPFVFLNQHNEAMQKHQLFLGIED